jgi:hypothetical protein
MITAEKISPEAALELMHGGSRLVETHIKSTTEWHVDPGGVVTGEAAKQIKQHRDVVGQQDGLFEGINQSYRMVSPR